MDEAEREPYTKTSTVLMQPINESVFSGLQAFEGAQRMAKALGASTLIPMEYRNNIPNCLIALEISNRVKASPLMVMQNLYIVYGRPGWSSQYIIAAINSCGRYSPLEFEMSGKENTDSWSCMAYAFLKSDPSKKVCGATVSVKMAKDEGWWNRKDKSGRNCSKWPTMTEVMLRYRSASFFGKIYVPEVLMGFQTKEEIVDVGQDDYHATSVKELTPDDLKLKAKPTVKTITTAQAEEFEKQLTNPHIKTDFLKGYGIEKVSDLPLDKLSNARIYINNTVQ